MRRLRKAFRLPLRYSVPIVVSIGYASEAERESKTLRLVGMHGVVTVTVRDACNGPCGV